jgi:transcriptional regulator with XRE-family HTH domain
MTETGSPTVRRMLLGQRLRTYRQAAELPPEAVARRMLTTTRTVLRWEAGQAAIRLRDLATLLDMYGVELGTAERSEAEALARETRRPGWWTPYNSEVRPTFRQFLGLEQGASSLREYGPVIVPGLLQTKRYMRAVMEASIPMLDDNTIDRRVEVRLKRQAEVLARAMPTHFVIDEAAFMRGVGGAEVMSEQIAYLIDIAKSRLVTIQVLPFGIGAHASILGGFIVLQIPEMGPVACVELEGGDLYAHGSDAARYTQRFDKLCEGALPEPHSLTLATRIREEHHAHN